MTDLARKFFGRELVLIREKPLPPWFNYSSALIPVYYLCTYESHWTTHRFLRVDVLMEVRLLATTPLSYRFLGHGATREDLLLPYDASPFRAVTPGHSW